MNSKESEYRELFLVEALENFEELNRRFIDLEKENNDQGAINAIFRITHTLKGNAMGMGFDAIAELSHVMEDVMGSIKNGDIKLNKEMFESLFKANDKLGELINALKTGKKVSYLGIKTKLSILHKNSLQNKGTEEPEAQDTGEGSIEEVEEAVHESAMENKEPQTPEPQSAEEAPKITFTEVIQIPVKKMDDLMNLVGQLIIERDRLISMFTTDNSSNSQFDSLQRISSNLQYNIMKARMVQVGFLFNKFHRIVRDVAALENKKVDLSLKGTEIEIDRNILKTMSDSMIHLVRNAVSHGIEDGETRKKNNKSSNGKITLDARYEKDRVVIMVSDDGKGIDAQVIRNKIIEKGLVNADYAKSLEDQDVLMYIFEPGFSSAEKVTEVSGRGVGMDVVKRTVESIGGQVTIDTEVGKGSTINMILPSSLALKGALLFELNKQEYAISLGYTEAVISLQKNEIHKISDGLMANYLEATIPIVFLNDLFSLNELTEISNSGILHRTFDELDPQTQLDVIVISYSGKFVGLVVDRLLQRKEIIEKTLPRPVDKVKLLSGTTILGNGNVCLVVDVAAITDLLFKSMKAESEATMT